MTGSQYFSFLGKDIEGGKFYLLIILWSFMNPYVLFPWFSRAFLGGSKAGNKSLKSCNIKTVSSERKHLYKWKTVQRKESSLKQHYKKYFEERDRSCCTTIICCTEEGAQEAELSDSAIHLCEGCLEISEKTLLENFLL